MLDLNEKYELEDIEQLLAKRRNSDIQMKDAIELKAEEIEEYSIKLYTSHHLNETTNKILESKHTITIENKILNFFIFLFSMFSIFQFLLVIVIKSDFDFPSLKLIEFETFFNYAYLSILFIGKNISYFCLVNFFLRLYIGVKIFQSSVNTNLLLKLLNYQFIGFLNTILITVAIISLDFGLKALLTRLCFISEEATSETYNTLLAALRNYTWFLDQVVYTTISIGLVFTGIWRSVKFFAQRRSVSL